MTLPSLQVFAAGSSESRPEMLIVAAGSVLVLGLAGLAALMMRRASSSSGTRCGCWDLPGAAAAGAVGGIAGLACPASNRGERHAPRPATARPKWRLCPPSESAPDRHCFNRQPRRRTIVNTRTDSRVLGSPRTGGHDGSRAFVTNPDVRGPSAGGGAGVEGGRRWAWTVCGILCWFVAVFLSLPGAEWAT